MASPTPVFLPTLSFGTYRMKGPTLIQSIKDAIEIGYRAIDTAAVYRNESDIGIALDSVIGDGIVKREDLFIQTKIGPSDQGYEETIACVNASLKAMHLTYLDCVLIHWPGKAKELPTSPLNKPSRLLSYKALLHLRDTRIIRSIGVSNFTQVHIDEIVNEFSDIPVLNQIEQHPLWNKSEHVGTDLGVRVQCYSLFGEGNFLNGEIVLASVERVCKREGCSRARVLMRWATMRGWLIAVKATSRARLEDNFGYESVGLTREDCEAIDNELHVHGEKKWCWNSEHVL